MEFTASRLSTGNAFNPNRILTNENEITIVIDSSDEVKKWEIEYKHLAEVSINKPLIGYCSLTFKIDDFEKVEVSGFEEAVAKEIEKITLHGLKVAKDKNEKENSFVKTYKNLIKGVSQPKKFKFEKTGKQNPEGTGYSESFSPMQVVKDGVELLSTAVTVVRAIKNK